MSFREMGPEMELETKFSKLEAEAVSDEGTIVGYASRFGIVDQGGDVVAKGAFSRSLKSRFPKMYWMHRSSEPIGKWIEAVEDETGLRVKGRLNMEVQRAREAHSLLKAGDINGLSIGFRTVKSSMQGNARKLEDIELYEVSIVSEPMLMEATVDQVKSIDDILSGAKSGDFVPLKRATEKALRDAGFPAWLAKAQAALAPQALGDGSRDASASEIAKLIRDSFKI